jgi:hypothetical protein
MARNQNKQKLTTPEQIQKHQGSSRSIEVDVKHTCLLSYVP